MNYMSVSCLKKRPALGDVSINIHAPPSKKVGGFQSQTPVQALMDGIKRQNHIQVCRAASSFHWSTNFGDLPDIYEVVVRFYESKIFGHLEPVLSNKPRLFHLALKHKHKSVVSDLISSYPDVIEKYIIQLILHKQTVIIKIFIEMNVISVLNERYKLLTRAALLGSENILYYMLDQVPVEKYRSRVVETAFFSALTTCKGDKTKCVDVFHHILGVEVIKEFRFQGKSPLYVAVELGLTTLAKKFIEDGHDVNEVSEQDYTPLDIAVRKKYFVLVKILLEADARVDIGGGEDKICAFNRAIVIEDLSIMKLIFDRHGSDALTLDEEGNTATHFAAYYGFMEGLLYLYSKDLISFAPDLKGATPIDTILLEGSTKGEEEKILEQLLICNENFRLTTPLSERLYGKSDGATYIHRIVQKGYRVLVASLLDKQKKKKPLLKYLQDREGGVVGRPRVENLIEVRDNSGNTPMHTAALRKDSEMMKIMHLFSL